MSETMGGIMESVLTEVRALRDELRVSRRPTMARDEAADYLGVSPRTLHELVVTGRIKRVRLSESRYVFRREEMDRYLVENEAFHEEPSETNGKRLYAASKGRK